MEDDRPIRVSVVDDDPMICQAMGLILNDYSEGRITVVSTSTDGKDAVRRAADERPDVVLMDIAMPGIDGIEATRGLRALSPAPHVLILTSLSPADTVERAVEAGAEGFVSKTDAPDEIIRRVIGVCEGTPPIQFGEPAAADRRTQQAASAIPAGRGARIAGHVARTRARSRHPGSRGLHERRNRPAYVHLRAHGQGASVVRRGQAVHGTGADGPARGTGRSAGTSVNGRPLHAIPTHSAFHLTASAPSILSAKPIHSIITALSQHSWR